MVARIMAVGVCASGYPANRDILTLIVFSLYLPEAAAYSMRLLPVG